MQSGAATVNNPGGAAPVVPVVVAQPSTSCTTKPTDAVTIDSNSFGDDDCASIDMTFVNGTESPQTLRFGAQGQNGLYTILGLPIDASNVAGVTADAGDGAVASVGPLQGMNWLTQNGIIVTALEITILAGTNQGQQKVTLNRLSVNVTDKCKTTTVKPKCGECFNSNDPTVYLFQFCRALDYYNNAQYTLVAGGSVNIQIRYAALATAQGYVGCTGQYQGLPITPAIVG